MNERKATRNNFKITELGPLPNDWEIARLIEVSHRPKYGFTASSTQREVGPKFLRITDIQDDKVNWEKVPYCECSYEDLEKYALKKNDILFARIGATTGKSYIVSDDVKAIFASYLIRIRTQARIDSSYLAQFAKSHIFWEQINSMKGGRLKQGINIPILNNLKIPLPLLPEQKKIGGVLMVVQEAREKTEEIIKGAKELKKSMMKHLFTYGPVPVEEAEKVKLKETEIGMVPEKWDARALGEIANFKNGINFSREQKGNKGILTIDVLNMYGEDIYIKPSNLYRVNKKINEEYLLKNGDILFVRSSLKQEGVGWTSLFREINEPVTYCGFIIRARLKIFDNLSPKFLTHYLRTDIARKNLIASSGKVAITNINQGMLSKIKFPMPSIRIQQKISDILSAIEKKIEAEENKKKALEELFKTLLNNLMTGKIRVHNLDIEI